MIQELLQSSNVQVIISPQQLLEFGEYLITQARTLNNVQQQPGEKLISATEVQQLLNVSATTLWRWDKTGYLKSVRVGRKAYYRQSDIERIKKGGSYE